MHKIIHYCVRFQIGVRKQPHEDGECFLKNFYLMLNTYYGIPPVSKKFHAISVYYLKNSKNYSQDKLMLEMDELFQKSELYLQDISELDKIQDLIKRGINADTLFLKAVTENRLEYLETILRSSKINIHMYNNFAFKYSMMHDYPEILETLIYDKSYDEGIDTNIFEICYEKLRDHLYTAILQNQNIRGLTMQYYQSLNIVNEID